MSESAVLTTAMSSMSIAVAAHTTVRVQRCVVVKVGLRGVSRGVTSMLPARGREHIRGFPSQTDVPRRLFLRRCLHLRVHGRGGAGQRAAVARQRGAGDPAGVAAGEEED